MGGMMGRKSRLEGRRVKIFDNVELSRYYELNVREVGEITRQYDMKDLKAVVSCIRHLDRYCGEGFVRKKELEMNA